MALFEYQKDIRRAAIEWRHAKPEILQQKFILTETVCQQPSLLPSCKFKDKL